MIFKVLGMHDYLSEYRSTNVIPITRGDQLQDVCKLIQGTNEMIINVDAACDVHNRFTGLEL